MLKKISSMLKKIWAVFVILRLPRKIIKVEKKFIAVLNFWLFWKNPDA
jgi:hypothetical protein